MDSPPKPLLRQLPGRTETVVGSRRVRVDAGALPYTADASTVAADATLDLGMRHIRVAESMDDRDRIEVVHQYAPMLQLFDVPVHNQKRLTYG